MSRSRAMDVRALRLSDTRMVAPGCRNPPLGQEASTTVERGEACSEGSLPLLAPRSESTGGQDVEESERASQGNILIGRPV